MLQISKRCEKCYFMVVGGGGGLQQLMWVDAINDILILKASDHVDTVNMRIIDCPCSRER